MSTLLELSLRRMAGQGAGTIWMPRRRTDGEVVGTRVARLPTRSSCLLSAASWPSRLQNGIGMPTTSTRARGSS
jgi:hypothetical protein